MSEELNSLHIGSVPPEVVSRAGTTDLFPIKNASFRDVDTNSLNVTLYGVPQKITFIAVQGFTDGVGSVGFHTELSTVTEMYFPLTGEVKVYKGLRSVDEDRIDFIEQSLVGQFSQEQIDRASLQIINTNSAPQLRVIVNGVETLINPFVISPGIYHGTIGVFEDQTPPTFLALKMMPTQPVL